MAKFPKTIIAVSGTANVGKTATLRILGSQLLANGGTTTEDLTPREYRAVFNYSRTVVGVQTFGDSEEVVLEGLAHFLQKKCDIIAMACKRYGGTTDVIHDFATQNGNRIIWASPYQTWDNLTDVDALKSTSATHIRLIIDEIIGGLL